MNELVGCGKCNRHVRSSDRHCPFCGARMRSRPRAASMIGRVTRAAIFYGASSMLGCGSEPAPAHEAPRVEPASEATTTEPALEPSRAEAPFPAPDVAPDTDEEARAERADAEGRKQRETAVHEAPDPPDVAPVPLYGGPPADFVV